ncbi:MAG: hypothetical protein PVH61_15510 [Candidatus Aminicenantes bacterium]|jgi:hypothetical protein
MSDFIEHLINRHLGKGEQVLPRARAKFEPDAAAAFLPQDAEEDPNTTQTDTEDLSVNSPAPDTPAVNSLGDYNPIKQPVRHQHQPGTPIEPEPGPVSQPIPGVPAQVDIENNNNKVSPNEPPIPANPPQEPVPGSEVVSKKKPDVHNYTIMNENRLELKVENRHEGIVQTVTKGLLQPLEQGPSAGFEKPGNPEQIATVNTKIQAGPINRQSHRQPAAVPELSPLLDLPKEFIEPRPIIKESQPVTPTFQDPGSGSRDFPAAAAPLPGTYQPALLEAVLSPELPVNGTGQETVIVEPQPLTPTLQDTGTGSPGLLEAPAWLAGRQSQVHKELFLMDSEAEAEPVINVTIGRIEVRAVKQQEPPPPRRFAPPKPKLALEDYLEQRNRGER